MVADSSAPARPPSRDTNAQARSIVERAIRDLVVLGMEPESAAHLLAVQGSIRMVDRKALQSLVKMIVDDHGLSPRSQCH